MLPMAKQVAAHIETALAVRIGRRPGVDQHQAIEDLRRAQCQLKADEAAEQPEVAQHLKRAALKKLFADPHFNVIDRFEAYSEDYTQADPIPAAMLRGLNQAKGLLFPHDDPKPDDPKPDDAKPDEPNQERALHAALDPLRNAEVEIETPAETRSEARSETPSEARPLPNGVQKTSIKSETYDSERHES